MRGDLDGEMNAIDESEVSSTERDTDVGDDDFLAGFVIDKAGSRAATVGSVSTNDPRWRSGLDTLTVVCMVEVVGVRGGGDDGNVDGESGMFVLASSSALFKSGCIIDSLGDGPRELNCGLVAPASEADDTLAFR